MPDVRLVDLELIRRYSLAVRQESADVAEVLALLEADRKAIEKLAAPKKPSRAAPGKAAQRASSPRKATAKARKSSR